MKKFIVCLITLILIVPFASIFYACGKDEEQKYEYVLTENIEYGSHSRQRLDICIPDSDTVGVMVFIHGGGWIGGDKSGYKKDLIEWAENYGYVTAAINYRYASESIHIDDIVSDIDMAMSKIKSVTTENGLDIHKALFTGGSAGGHLSMYYAYAKRDTAPITPACVVDYCGPTDLTDSNYFIDDGNLDATLLMASLISGTNLTIDNIEENMEQLLHTSPITFVDENTVPTVVCHGDKDDLVPYSNALRLIKEFDKYNIRYDIVTYINSGHGLESESGELRATILMKEYAETYLR